MNNQFIIVTLRVTKRKCRVNVNHIRIYVIDKGNNFTSIQSITSKDDIEVIETPEQIDELINYPIEISVNINPEWDEERRYWKDKTIPN